MQGRARRHKRARLTFDQLLRALVKSNPSLTLDGARAIIGRLDLLDEGQAAAGREAITRDAFLAIHEILLAASAQEEEAQLDRLMEAAARRGVRASREQAARELAAQGGHIGRALNRLA